MSVVVRGDVRPLCDLSGQELPEYQQLSACQYWRESRLSLVQIPTHETISPHLPFPDPVSIAGQPQHASPHKKSLGVRGTAPPATSTRSSSPPLSRGQPAATPSWVPADNGPGRGHPMRSRQIFDRKATDRCLVRTCPGCLIDSTTITASLHQACPYKRAKEYNFITGFNFPQSYQLK